MTSSINTKESPLISIALCTYNGQEFLEEQLNSLIQQDYRPIEIIAIDDCSSDNTFTILQRYEKLFPYFTAIRNTENIGFLKNFELNLSYCKGDYIAFCDQDDIWMPNKLSLQIENIGENGLVYHDSALIDESGCSLSTKISDLINMYQGDSPLPFLLRNCVPGHSIFINRKLLKYFIPFKIEYHDWWAAYVAANTTGLKYLNCCLVKYRQHGNSSTKILKQSQENYFYPPFTYLQVFQDFDNKIPALISSICNVYKQYNTYTFTYKDAFVLLKTYKTFFYISKVSNKRKLRFVLSLILKKFLKTKKA